MGTVPLGRVPLGTVPRCRSNWESEMSENNFVVSDREAAETLASCDARYEHRVMVDEVWTQGQFEAEVQRILESR